MAVEVISRTENFLKCAFFLSPVHTSNNVEATLDFVEATFDFVANGNNVERVVREISFFDKVETN